MDMSSTICPIKPGSTDLDSSATYSGSMLG
jgi:hypothetical protein